MIDITKLQAQIESGELVAEDEVVLEGATPYAIWKQLNNVFAQLKIVRDTPITPQYIYNLARQGKINPTKKGSQTNVRYTDDEVEAFITKMVAQNLKFRQI